MPRKPSQWAIYLAVLIAAGCGHEAARAPTAHRSTEGVARSDAASNRATGFDCAAEYAIEGEEASPADWGATEAATPMPSRAVEHYADESSDGPAAGHSYDDYGDREPRFKGRDDTHAFRNRSVPSGMLTAGSFDDQEQFEAFCSFLTESLQNDPRNSGPRFAIGQRALILVTNEQGEPVGGARVAIRAMDQRQQERQLIELETGSDGRAVFLTAMDGGGSYSQDYLVCVTPPDGRKPVTLQTQANGQPWRVVLRDTASQRPIQLDSALVVDTTGSMGDELEYLKSEIDDIAATIDRMFPNVDQRYALVVYRDQGDQYVTRSYDFTGSLSEFRSVLSTQRAGGGGDYPEAMHTALENASDLNWRGRDTARVMFLVGDAPPHDHFADRTLDAVRSLRSQGVRIFPVAASGAARKAEFVMRTAAFLTMGQYLFLTDHSGVGNPHAAPHVPEYQVEHLNRLMVRMIAEQLAGKHLAPQEIIAIEQGDPQPLRFQPPTWQCEQPPVQVSCYHPRKSRPSLASMLPSLASLLPFRWVLLGLLVSGLVVFDIVRTRQR